MGTKKLFYNLRLFDGINDGLRDGKAILVADGKIRRIIDVRMMVKGGEIVFRETPSPRELS